MKINLDKEPFVRIGNPKTMECEALRISLLPGILKTVAANKHVSLPLRMFEVTMASLYHCSYHFLYLCCQVKMASVKSVLKLSCKQMDTAGAHKYVCSLM